MSRSNTEEVMQYKVYLETSDEAIEEGGYLAHLPALIGCVARGDTKEETLAKLYESIDAYTELMTRRGVAMPSTDEIELDVVEVDGMTYPSDYEPFDDDALHDVEERSAATRQELLAEIEALPEGGLDWQANEDDWLLWHVLAHISTADLWYASRLEEDGHKALLFRLAESRKLVLERLRALPEADRAKVTTLNDEEWTPNKVARRVVEHELEHIDHIRQIVAANRAAG